RHEVERVVPPEALPAILGAPQRKQEAVGMVEAILQIVVDLVAEGAPGERMVGITAQPHDPAVLDVGDDPAGVEAVEGAGRADRAQLTHPVSAPEAQTGSVPPQTTARMVAPFTVVPVWTHPLGR